MGWIMAQSKSKKKPKLTITINIFEDHASMNFSDNPTYGQLYAAKIILDECIDFNCPDLFTRAQAMLWVAEHIENVEEVPRE